MGALRLPIDVRLQRLSAVDTSTGCWNWLGYRSEWGYGRVAFNGKAAAAHRVSYIVFRGAIPRGKFVCHSCDNKACINPDHLFIGDQQSNMDDMARKGRRLGKIAVSGERCWKSKLTEKQVLEMRSTCFTASEAAMKFGISYKHAWTVLNWKTWRHI